MSTSRQLVAILFTDIAGYTAMMQEDEEKAVAVLRQYTSILREKVGQYQGTVVNDYGDGNLCTFASATQAMRCAIDLQRRFQSEPIVPLRMGLHIGEVFFEDGKVLGDGVNVASRIQSLGVANSILYSAEIQTKISNQAEFKSVSLGSIHFKNVKKPMEVFASANEGLNVPQKGSFEGKLKAIRTSWRIWMAAAALTILVIIGLSQYLQSTSVSTTESKKSVAVLAFEDLSPGKDQDWFSDGISEEIINSLANLSELRVIARTSSFYFKDKNMTLAQIASKLDVRYFIVGSVRKQAGNLRISVQLIDAAEDAHLFSQTYDRPDSDLFKVQLEIAKGIADKLLDALTPRQESRIKTERPSSVNAYEYYLRGVKMHVDNYSATRLDKSFIESRELLMKSISLDPKFAQAYAALADLYDSRGNTETYRTESWRMRDSLSLVAYAINRNSYYVLLIRALTFSKAVTTNLDSAFHYFSRAYAVNPTDPYLSVMIGHFYSQIGLDDLASKFYQRTLEFDPLNVSARAGLATGLMYMGEFEHAEEEYKRTLELDSSGILSALATVYLYEGRLKQGELTQRKAQELTNTVRPIEKALLYAMKGRKEDALNLSKDIRILMALGMKKETLEQLDTLSTKPIPLIDHKVANILFSVSALESSPLWNFVRGEPEFIRILERVKKTQIEKLRLYGSLDSK